MASKGNPLDKFRDVLRPHPYISYLYNLVVQTSFQICYILLLLGHPSHMYHGNHMWLYPCNKVFVLQDSSQTHCLVWMGMGILLLKNVFNKTYQYKQQYRPIVMKYLRSSLHDPIEPLGVSVAEVQFLGNQVLNSVPLFLCSQDPRY